MSNSQKNATQKEQKPLSKATPNSQSPPKQVFSKMKNIFAPPPSEVQSTDETTSIHALTHAESKTNPTDELIAVIVTLRGGASYDDMYTHVPQKGPEGTRIAVWGAGLTALKPITMRLASLPPPAATGATERKQESPIGPWEASSASSATSTTTTVNTTTTTATTPASAATTTSSSASSTATARALSPFEQLLKDIAEVEPDSVVFNFECCSTCDETRGFGIPDIMPVIETLIKRGHTVMCSDFTLKALISQWRRDTPYLGPNPFRQVGTFTETHTLTFDPEVLAKCCSTQLQKVGDLCKDGQAVVKALGGTILYTANKEIADTNEYKLEVLTIVSSARGANMASYPPAETWSVKGTKGICGHTVLTYPSGGKLITSCGHWIELVALDVSEEALLRVAKTEYGEQYMQELQTEMTSAPDAESRKMVVQTRAARMVQSSAPQEYSKGYGRSKANFRGKEQ